MTAKQQADAKISLAVADCEKAQNAWNAAHQALSGSVSTNGYGIYHGNGGELCEKLQVAQNQIKAALSALSEVDWPTDADYNLV